MSILIILIILIQTNGSDKDLAKVLANRERALYRTDIVIYYTNEAAARLGRLLPPGHCLFSTADGLRQQSRCV